MSNTKTELTIIKLSQADLFEMMLFENMKPVNDLSELQSDLDNYVSMSVGEAKNTGLNIDKNKYKDEFIKFKEFQMIKDKSNYSFMLHNTDNYEEAKTVVKQMKGLIKQYYPELSSKARNLLDSELRNIRNESNADKAMSDWLDNQIKQGKLQDISRAHWDEDDDPLTRE